MNSQIIQKSIQHHRGDGKNEPSSSRGIRGVERTNEWIDDESGKKTEIDRRASNTDAEFLTKHVDGSIVKLMANAGEAQGKSVCKGLADASPKRVKHGDCHDRCAPKTNGGKEYSVYAPGKIHAENSVGSIGIFGF
jgi:hypothetical protein